MNSAIRRRVGRIKEYIAAGDAFQVLLARRIRVKQDFPSDALYRLITHELTLENYQRLFGTALYPTTILFSAGIAIRVTAYRRRKVCGSHYRYTRLRTPTAGRSKARGSRSSSRSPESRRSLPSGRPAVTGGRCCGRRSGSFSRVRRWRGWECRRRGR